MSGARAGRCGRPLAVLLLAFVIQNTEEAVFLPFWAMAHLPALAGSLGDLTISQFALAAGLLNLFAIAVGVFGWRQGGPLGVVVLALIGGALLANALSHVAMSLATGSVMPGAVSGLVLQGPAALWLLLCLPLTPAQAVGATALGLAVVPAFSLPALALARFMLN